MTADLSTSKLWVSQIFAPRSIRGSGEGMGGWSGADGGSVRRRATISPWVGRERDCCCDMARVVE